MFATAALRTAFKFSCKSTKNSRVERKETPYERQLSHLDPTHLNCSVRRSQPHSDACPTRPGPEPDSHRHRGRYLHLTCDGRFHRWPLLSHRYAYSAWGRTSTPSPRFRRDL